MTTEDEFQALLDEHPEDYQTRLVFADWLQERGDPRAEGYRALGVGRFFPEDNLRDSVWGGDDHPCRNERKWREGHRHLLLPAEWFRLIPFRKKTHDWQQRGHEIWKRFPRGRREAEDAAALAFSKLPAERRAELLAGQGVAP